MIPRIFPAPVLAALLAGVLFSAGVRAQAPTHANACATDGEVPALLVHLISAHEQGQLEVLGRLLDDRMPGHQALLDASIRQRQTHTRTKIHVQNLHLQCAPQAASIAFGWEKRALGASDQATTLAAGNTSILLASRLHEGKARWRVVAISEPNPFWQRTTAPAQLPALPAEPSTPADPAPSPRRSPVPNG